MWLEIANHRRWNGIRGLHHCSALGGEAFGAAIGALPLFNHGVIVVLVISDVLQDHFK